MRSRVSLLSLLTCVALSLGATAVHAQAREQGRLLVATQVLEELRASRDQYIPDRLLDRAYGIAVIPDVTKVAFVAGGRRGKGVLVVRDKDGRFTNPVFIALTGGSFGWQAGVQSTDIVLVFTTREGIEGITDGKMTLGADASVAAGPVGRQASAATDASFTAEVYSYSRNRGLFAGVALDGSALTIDRRANQEFYDKTSVTATDIINGSVQSDSEVSRKFLAAVSASTGTRTQAQAPAAGTAPAQTDGSFSSSPPPSNPPASSAPPSGGAQTFPMEDPQPGQEPR
jgi:lipid-binding SYLF domain-containing protein